MEVSGILENWYRIHKRNLPWRDLASPYHIWISEIILQQTRVDQGLEYYVRFVEKYPTIQELANAPIDDILRMWQGLGYYTRARNLHATARVIADSYKGKFPEKVEELLKLKGVGNYTAAAIASIAFKKPVALVDGNVSRVISRLFGIDKPVNSVEGRSHFMRLAGELLNWKKPDIHNQAMMEFGALVCTPQRPKCIECVLAETCYAFQHGKVDELPIKKAKIKRRERYFNYLFIQCDGLTLLRKRNNKDIWHSLFEFPMIETESHVEFGELLMSPRAKSFQLNGEITLLREPVFYRHQLTHQLIMCYFYLLSVNKLPDLTGENFFSIPVDSIQNYAIPRVIDRFMEELNAEGLL